MTPRRVSLFSLAGSAVLLLVLLRLGLAWQQSKASGRPAEPVYGFRLPDLSHAEALGLNAYGKYPTTHDAVDVYWHDGVNTQAGVRRYRGNHCEQIVFNVERTNVDNWAGLREIFFTPDFAVDSSAGVCGFPGPVGLTYPFCIQDFLNRPHPQEGYDHIQFSVHIFTYLEDIRPEMGRLLLSNGDWGAIYSWTKSECDVQQIPGPSSTRHRVVAEFRTSDDSVDGGSLSIQRIETNTWRIFIEHQCFSVKEEYCVPVLVTGKRGQIYTSTKTHTPFEGCTYPVSLTLDLVRK